MSALDELRARVEAATGADRMIDALVLQLAEPGRRFLEDAGSVRERREARYGLLGDQDLQSFAGDYWSEAAIADYVGAPAYTASLDAVLALVGEKLPGWTVRADLYADHASVSVEHPFTTPDEHFRRPRNVWGGEANTPALALLSALLAALANTETSRVASSPQTDDRKSRDEKSPTPTGEADG